MFWIVGKVPALVGVGLVVVEFNTSCSRIPFGVAIPFGANTAEMLLQIKHLGCIWPQPGQQRRSTRTAEWKLAVSVIKARAARCQPITMLGVFTTALP